jgi:hypothetical protein
MISMVYVSAARRLFSEDELAALLYLSRANNQRDGITGLLLYMDGNFMQAIEGEESAIEDLQQRLAADPRHTQMTTILKLGVERRRFRDWSMGFTNIDHLPDADRHGFSDFLASTRDGPTRPRDDIAWRLLERFKTGMR